MASIGATLTVVVTNQRQKDSEALAKVQAVAIDRDMQCIGSTECDPTVGFVLPLLSDVTTDTVPGSIQRVVSGEFSPNFRTLYPTDAQRIEVLQGALGRILSKRIPCVIGSETVVLIPPAS